MFDGHLNIHPCHLVFFALCGIFLSRMPLRPYWERLFHSYQNTTYYWTNTSTLWPCSNWHVLLTNYPPWGKLHLAWRSSHMLLWQGFFSYKLDVKNTVMLHLFENDSHMVVYISWLFQFQQSTHSYFYVNCLASVTFSLWPRNLICLMQ